jgi:hypothetical protein
MIGHFKRAILGAVREIDDLEAVVLWTVSTVRLRAAGRIKAARHNVM